MQCISLSRQGPHRPAATVRAARATQFRIHAFSERPLQLPGGEHWWLGTSKHKSAVIYGENFVLQRPQVGGEGLIPATKDVSVERFIPKHRPSPPAVRPPKQPMDLTFSGVVVVDTEFEVIFSESPLSRRGHRALPESSHTASFLPNTSCTGIVYKGSSDGLKTQDMGASNTRHPRRTRRLRFTCNLCGEVNLKNINPRAWQKGSVFCRCEGCTAVHKLKDNLKIFHELRGPVFPPRDLRNSFPAVKEILDRIEAKKRWERGDVA